MEIHFNKIRDFVYEVDLDIPYSYSEIFSDLINEDWIPISGTYGEFDSIKRYKTDWILKSTKLKDIRDYACSDQFRRCVVDRFYEESEFGNMWGIDSDHMFRSTTTFSWFLRDSPGYHCGIHLDSRTQVATSLIFLADHDNADIGTEFYTTNTRENSIRIPTGFGRGWIAANTYNSWHDGWNRSQCDRYSMIIGLMLKI